VIPVVPQDEPADFHEKVRARGLQFLSTVEGQVKWDSHEYWRDAIPDLRKAYRSVCAYLAHWIPSDTGSATVDHFIPVSAHPELAYEWANYRLACCAANSRKWKHQDVLDPFSIEYGWFTLDLLSLMVSPGTDIGDELTTQVMATIKRLGLNHESVTQGRLHWLRFFCATQNLALLREWAPFIAHELERQNLVDVICDIIGQQLQQPA
jgi:hypothetical protein